MDSTVFPQFVLIADVVVVRSLVGVHLVRVEAVVADLVGTVATGVTDYRSRDLAVTQNIRWVIYTWGATFDGDRWLGRSRPAAAHHPTCEPAQDIGSFC